MTKVCTGCHEIKPRGSFPPKGGKCLACKSVQRKAKYLRRREHELERNRLYRLSNKDEIFTARRRYRANNAEEIAMRKSAYEKENREKIREKKRDWRTNNHERILVGRRKWVDDNREHMRVYWRTRMADPKQRVRHSMSNAIARSLSSGKQGLSWERLVGYTCDDLRRHLETLFRDGMNWANYGAKSGAEKWWSIDHVISQKTFNYPLAGTPEFRECWGLDNLQPLWHTENCSKQHLRDGCR